jgi:hypothetical protein
MSEQWRHCLSETELNVLAGGSIHSEYTVKYAAVFVVFLLSGM